MPLASSEQKLSRALAASDVLRSQRDPSWTLASSCFFKSSIFFCFSTLSSPRKNTGGSCWSTTSKMLRSIASRLNTRVAGKAAVPKSSPAIRVRSTRISTWPSINACRRSICRKRFDSEVLYIRYTHWFHAQKWAWHQSLCSFKDQSVCNPESICTHFACWCLAKCVHA